MKVVKVKDKKRILKTREEWLITYKGNPIKLSANFPAKSLQARKEWHDIFKMLKEKNCQPRILYLARLSFRIEEEVKSFTEKQKLKEFITTRTALQEMVKEFL